QGDVDGVARFVADERRAHGGLVADAAQADVGLGRTGDVIFLGILGLVALGQYLDPHADGDGGVGQLAVVDDARDLERGLDVGDARLDDGLLLFGGVILGVFAQVAVTARDFDLIRHFFAFDGAQFVQFLFQLLVTLPGNDDFFRV